MTDSNTAAAQTYATGCYSMKDIAQTFAINYATVSRIVKKSTKVYECKT